MNRLVTLTLGDLRIHLLPFYILCVFQPCGYATSTCNIAVVLRDSPEEQGGKSSAEVFSEDILQWIKQATPVGPEEPFDQLQDVILMLQLNSMEG